MRKLVHRSFRAFAFVAGIAAAGSAAAQQQTDAYPSRPVRMIIPLATNGIVATSVFVFIAAWNEFLFALTFTSSNDTRTVTVAIALLSGATPHEIPWGPIMAASVIVTVPLVVLVLIFQRKIISGLTAGGVKG